MRRTLLQVDDFAPDALAVREAVIDGGFKDETGPDGLPYSGISRVDAPQWAQRLAALHHGVVDIKLACFRLNLVGEKPHSWVHSDELCRAQWAGVLYLTLPAQCRGGTAFWRHRALNVDALDSPESLVARGINAEWYYGMMNREWRDLTWWEMHTLIGMKFNRFVTYPTSVFHSRYPFESFGTDARDGRLIWACFYDVL